MSSDTKAMQVRVYLSAEQRKTLQEIKTRLQTQSEAWILSTLAAAALIGIKDGGYKFPLPLKLGIVPEQEPKSGKK